MDGLPWPSKKVPDAFKARGNADLNHPDSVNWLSVLTSVHKYQLQIEEKLLNTTPKTPPRNSVIIVEGLLLLADHEGADMLRTEIDKYVVIGSKSDKQSQDKLCRRKFTRSHLGKISYQQKGVSLEDYQCYWNSYVTPSWEKHGQSRIGEVCPDALTLDCFDEWEVSVDKLLNTGWFSKKSKSKPIPHASDGNKKKPNIPPETSWPRESESEGEEDDDEEEDDEDEKRYDQHSRPNESYQEQQQQSDDDESTAVTVTTEPSGPSLKAFLFATVAAALASTLEPMLRAGVLVGLGLVYWVYRQMRDQRKKNDDSKQKKK
jgi:hypothetical protein